MRSAIATLLAVVVASFGIVFLWGLFQSEEEYGIEISVREVQRQRVEFTIQTNLPLPVEVMASVSAVGQAPTDTYIGVSRRIKLTTPLQVVNIGGVSENLPAGQYEAEVTFYSNWGAENGPRVARRITQDISDKVEIKLQGSGETRDDVERRDEGQKWLMLNVGAGEIWDREGFEDHLGPFTEVSSTLNNHRALYYEESDVTVLVNQTRQTVGTWRLGLASQ